MRNNVKMGIYINQLWWGVVCYSDLCVLCIQILFILKHQNVFQICFESLLNIDCWFKTFNCFGMLLHLKNKLMHVFLMSYVWIFLGSHLTYFAFLKSNNAITVIEWTATNSFSGSLKCFYPVHKVQIVNFVLFFSLLNFQNFPTIIL